MDDTSKRALLSALRSVLIIIGSIFTAHGYGSDAAMSQAIGAVMVIVPILWGVWDKFHAEEIAKAREVVALNVGIKVADNTQGATPLVAPTEAPSIIKTIAPTLAVQPQEKGTQ